MRICMIISTPFPPEEGIGNYVYNLSSNLILRGHEVLVVTRGGINVEVDHIGKIKVIRTLFVPLYPCHVHIHGFFVNRLIKKYIESYYDLIHIHTPLAPNIKTSLPVICTVHTSLIEDAKFIELVDLKSLGHKLMTKRISYPIVSNLLTISQAVTTVSCSVSNELSSYYNFQNAKIVGNGVNENIFIPLPDTKTKKYILFVGRLSYRKGLFDILDAMNYIKDNNDVNLILVGKGELQKKLNYKIKSYNLENRVRFEGYVTRDRLIKLYQNASIFVLPSHYEGLPTVLLEAMACGLPVIASAVSGCLDVIENEHNGLLVPRGSPIHLANSILRLLENEALRIELGRNARKTIEDNYTWDIIASLYEIHYKLGD